MTTPQNKSLEGQAKLTVFGKKLRGSIMYSKGREFIGASILLKQNQEKPSFVQIYLLLQGIEILLKGVLLMEEYEKYTHRILKNKFHHNIPKLIKEIRQVYNIKRVDPKFEIALNEMLAPDPWISLRYNGLTDFFHDPGTLDTEIIYKKIIQFIKAIENRFT